MGQSGHGGQRGDDGGHHLAVSLAGPLGAGTTIATTLVLLGMHMAVGITVIPVLAKTSGRSCSRAPNSGLLDWASGRCLAPTTHATDTSLVLMAVSNVYDATVGIRDRTWARRHRRDIEAGHR